MLRENQEQQLIATARGVATALQDRPGLIAAQTPPAEGAAPASGTATEHARLLIAGLARPGLRIWVVDNKLKLVAVAGDLKGPPPAAPGSVTFGPLERVVHLALRPLFERLHATAPGAVRGIHPERRRLRRARARARARRLAGVAPSARSRRPRGHPLRRAPGVGRRVRRGRRRGRGEHGRHRHAAQPRFRATHRRDADRVRRRGAGALRLRVEPVVAAAAAARRGGERHRLAGSRARARRRRARPRRDRRPLAQLLDRAPAPRAVQRLPGAARRPADARAAHADRRGALVPRQPAALAGAARSRRLPRARGRGPESPRDDPDAHGGGDASRADRARGRARALRCADGRGRLRGRLRFGLPRRDGSR